MTSLKTILNNLIKDRGEVPIEDIYKVCLEEGYKISNAERRLRKSESPNILGLEKKNKRGVKYIYAYKYVGEKSVEGVYDINPGGQLFVYKVHEPITKFKDPN